MEIGWSETCPDLLSPHEYTYPNFVRTTVWDKPTETVYIIYFLFVKY